MAEKHRCEAVSDFLRRLQRRLEIRTQGEMAKTLFMSESRYKARLRDPSKLSLEELWLIQTVGRRAGLELKEVQLLP